MKWPIVTPKDKTLDINLNTLSLKELRDLHASVAKAIAGFEDRKKKEAIGILEEKARELGFSFSELSGVTSQRKRTPAVAKYANPQDASQTWSGRGRKPLWFVAALASGKSVDDLAI
jgi:DNA-binding protein H-NS